MTRFIPFLILSIFSILCVVSAEENFLLVNGKSSDILLEIGPHIDERVTPCSTFKIALSLMGFDAGILQNENTPLWLFHEGYDDFLEAWKNPQTPRSWMKNSCIWFSRVLANRLEIEKFKFYLAAFSYGNQDTSGGLTNAWLSSSLKISPREQVIFLQKILQNEHPVSSSAIDMTKRILFIEELLNGWKLFGKTGSGFVSNLDQENQLGWFIGWVENEDDFFPFAYTICESKINLSQRIPRVKELLVDANVMNEKP